VQIYAPIHLGDIDPTGQKIPDFKNPRQRRAAFRKITISLLRFCTMFNEILYSDMSDVKDLKF